MGIFTRFSLKNALVIIMIIIMLIIGGIYSAGSIKTELMPNISFPVASVVTIYPGAAPEDVAENISRPIQKALSGINGLKEINTISNDSVSLIILKFSYSTDMDKAEKAIQDTVNKVKLPDKAMEPSVEKISYGSIPIVSYSISSKKSNIDLSKVIREKVESPINGVDGVSGAQTGGLNNKSIYIKVDEAKMYQSGLTLQTIQQALSSNDISFPGGTMELEGKTLPVQVSRKIRSIEDIKSIVLPVTSASNTMQPGVHTVKLSDIAKINLEEPEQSSLTRANQKPTVVLTVFKNDDANSVQTAVNVDNKMEEIQKDNPDLKIEKIEDTTKMITDSINGLVREGLLGALFAILIIALFLRDIRATIIAIVSIPLSILITMIMLPKLNITLNIMTLSGIAVAIGRIVDDSIVVIENIYRRLQRQKNHGVSLVEEATGEVSSAITTSTLTTIAVFLPLGLVSGVVGKVFLPFALTVVICILSSLLVAVTVVPLMSKFMLLKKPMKHKEGPSRIENGYKKVLSFALSHRLLVILSAVGLLIVSVLLVFSLGFQFLPSEDTKTISAKLELPAGTSLTVTNREVMKMEEYLAKNKSVETVVSTIGDTGGEAALFLGLQGTNQASMTIILKEDADSKKSLAAIKEKARELEGGKALWTITSQSSYGSTERLEVVVNGNNIEDITHAADLITKELKTFRSLSNLTNNLSAKKPEISIKVDSEKAASCGMNPMFVAAMFRSAMTYDKITTVENEGKTIDVLIGLDRNKATSLAQIENFPVMTLAGPKLLKDLAVIEKSEGPVSISERDGKRFASITADIVSDNTAATANDVMKKIKELENQFKPGITYNVGGSVEDMNESFSQMGMAMMIAVFLVFITMVIAFKEGTAPLSILFCLPFAAVGALFALWLSHHPLSMSGMVGLLMLIGIVVTNAVVLVDRVQTNRTSGMNIREALLEAGSVRLRPIIMTAAATVMALLPLALGLSEGAIISEELGIVVIGGLTVSTLLTLVIVPVAYSLLEGLKDRITGRKDSAISA